MGVGGGGGPWIYPVWHESYCTVGYLALVTTLLMISAYPTPVGD